MGNRDYIGHGILAQENGTSNGKWVYRGIIVVTGVVGQALRV